MRRRASLGRSRRGQGTRAGGGKYLSGLSVRQAPAARDRETGCGVEANPPLFPGQNKDCPLGQQWKNGLPV